MTEPTKCPHCGAPQSQLINRSTQFGCGTVLMAGEWWNRTKWCMAREEARTEDRAARQKVEAAHAETVKQITAALAEVERLSQLPIGEFIENEDEIVLEVIVDRSRFNPYAENLGDAVLAPAQKGGAS